MMNSFMGILNVFKRERTSCLHCMEDQFWTWPYRRIFWATHKTARQPDYPVGSGRESELSRGLTRDWSRRCWLSFRVRKAWHRWWERMIALSDAQNLPPVEGSRMFSLEKKTRGKRAAFKYLQVCYIEKQEPVYSTQSRKTLVLILLSAIYEEWVSEPQKHAAFGQCQVRDVHEATGRCPISGVPGGTLAGEERWGWKDRPEAPPTFKVLRGLWHKRHVAWAARPGPALAHLPVMGRRLLRSPSSTSRCRSDKCYVWCRGTSSPCSSITWWMRLALHFRAEQRVPSAP